MSARLQKGCQKADLFANVFPEVLGVANPQAIDFDRLVGFVTVAENIVEQFDVRD